MSKRRKRKKRPPKITVQCQDDYKIFLEALENMSAPPIKPDDWEEEAIMQTRSDRSRGSSGAAKRRGDTSPDLTLDLHGLSVLEAQTFVERAVTALLQRSLKPVMVRVITGKGRHSSRGVAVLAREIYDFVRQQYASQIISIGESPADLIVNGLPLRGHFDVVLRAL